MKCFAKKDIKDCCNQENCCEECGYEDCHEGCSIYNEIGNCQNCDFCDILYHVFNKA